MTESRTSELLLGNSEQIRRVRTLIERVAPTRLSILLEGPTGSGKELAARAIHLASKRRGNLIAFNVCAIADSMFEDTLFGHVRGAFTGAMHEASGYLAEANGGTLFLDEISTLEMSSQPKLLRAIELGVFRPVGARLDRHSDFRVVCASNQDLQQRVRVGSFRLDLLHRLSGTVITLPSLASRPDDIPVLAEHFLNCCTREKSHQVSQGALRLLQEYSWPGNVRELRQVIERVAAFATSQYIVRQDVSDALPGHTSAIVASEGACEKRRLITVLESVNWNTAKAARSLDMHRGTLYRHMKRLGISVPTRAISTLSNSLELARGLNQQAPQLR